MRSNSILSLFLVALTTFIGLVTLCPDGEGHGFSVHFITEICDTHDCNRIADTHDCRSDDCDHGVCGDVEVGAPYYPAQHFNYVSTQPPTRFFIEEHIESATGIPGALSDRQVDIITLQRSSVLRI